MEFGTHPPNRAKEIPFRGRAKSAERKCGKIRHLRWTWQRILAEWRRQPWLAACVVTILFACALWVVIRTIRGLTNFRDVGYPDSATLLRISGTVRSGHIYPAIDRPPYLVTLYGPLTYILLGLPYALARAAGLDPQAPVRLAIVGVLGVCAWVVYLISRRLYGSRPIAWLCALVAVSITPFTGWSTQIRGDFLAVAFSLLSVYLFLCGDGSTQLA